MLLSGVSICDENCPLCGTQDELFDETYVIDDEAGAEVAATNDDDSK